MLPARCSRKASGAASRPSSALPQALSQDSMPFQGLNRPAQATASSEAPLRPSSALPQAGPGLFALLAFARPLWRSRSGRTPRRSVARRRSPKAPGPRSSRSSIAHGPLACHSLPRGTRSCRKSWTCPRRTATMPRRKSFRSA